MWNRLPRKVRASRICIQSASASIATAAPTSFLFLQDKTFWSCFLTTKLRQQLPPCLWAEYLPSEEQSSRSSARSQWSLPSCMGWSFGNSSVHSSPVTAGRGKLHRWVSSKSYPIFTSHFHIRTWHKILKEWATTNRINNGIMQDPAKMKVLILFGCSNMYCGKL